MGSTLDQRLLRLLRDRAPRAVHVGELVTRAGLPREKFDEVLDILERFRDDGRAVEMPGRRYRFARDTPRPSQKEHAPHPLDVGGSAPRASREAPRHREPDTRAPSREAPRHREADSRAPSRDTPRPRDADSRTPSRDTPRARDADPRTSSREAPRSRDVDSRTPSRDLPRSRDADPRTPSREAPRSRDVDSRTPSRDLPRSRDADSRTPSRDASRPRTTESRTPAREAPRGRASEGRSAPARSPSNGGRDDRFARSRDAAPPEQATSIVRGVLMLHARGFGFITPDDGRGEVHIAPHDIGPALHGDRVEVEARFGFRGREGRVVGIVERRRPRLVGTLHGDFARSLVFSPGDPRLPETMRILPPIPRDIAVGDAVVAEIREYPQNREDSASVVITEKLGAPGDVGVEVERILARDGVVESFSADALAEAARIPDHVSAAEAEGRRDLRDIPLSTVDPDDARDHDDALFAEQLPDGTFRIVIAIADVSHYVRPGTAIDADALARCTSIYLPSRAIPMLPREISSKMASLLPGEDRLCMGVEVHMGPHGQIREHTFFEGVMRSRARITYGGAARALGLSEEPRRQVEAEGQLPSLRALLAASKILRTKRERRGSIDFDLPEAKIVLGDDGAPTDVAESRRDPGVREAYRMVEEMMLLANELVAEHLTKLGLPAIHRIHPPPEEKRIETFCELAQSLGHDLDVEDARRPKALAQFVAKTADTKEAPVLRFLLLRAMAQAAYSIDDSIGHFGLAATHYLHFTSPIRRYPDLAVHRVLRAWLRKEPIDRAALVPKLRMQSVESSRLERRAMNVERDVVKVHEVAVMRDRVGDVYEGAISSVDTDLITVRLDSPFVDITLELQRFTTSRYELDKLGLRLTSRTGHTFASGDRMRVEIIDANMGLRRVFGVPAREESREVAATAAKKPHATKAHDTHAKAPTHATKAHDTHAKAPTHATKAHDTHAKAPQPATHESKKALIATLDARAKKPSTPAVTPAKKPIAAHATPPKSATTPVVAAKKAAASHVAPAKVAAPAKKPVAAALPAKKTAPKKPAVAASPAKKAVDRPAPKTAKAKPVAETKAKATPLRSKTSTGTVAAATEASRRKPATKRSSPHGTAASPVVDSTKARRKPTRER